jgi:hypothetical protein
MENILNNIDVNQISPEDVNKAQVIGDVLGSTLPTAFFIIALVIVGILFLRRALKDRQKRQGAVNQNHIGISRTAFSEKCFAIVYKNTDHPEFDCEQYLKVFDNNGKEISVYAEVPGQTILGVYNNEGILCMLTKEDDEEVRWYWDTNANEFLEYDN